MSSFFLYLFNKDHAYVGDDWTDCFTLSPISLPPSPYVGFSAMTGDVFDAHE